MLKKYEWAIKNGQCRDTCSIGKQNEDKQKKKLKKMSNMDPYNNRG
jgi:hypothetical protein